MRVSPSVLRNAATNPNFRMPVAVPGVQQGGPSTDGALRSAIRRFHDSGRAGAHSALSESLVNTFWTSGKGLTMARHARTCLEMYITLAEGDVRQSFTGSRRSWYLGDVEFSVNPDMILFDGDGYAPRICLAGPLPQALSASQRILIAAPTILAVAEEMDGGYGRLNVTGAEVWELRSGKTGVVSRADADGSLDALQALMSRIQPG